MSDGQRTDPVMVVAGVGIAGIVVLTVLSIVFGATGGETTGTEALVLVGALVAALVADVLAVRWTR